MKCGTTFIWSVHCHVWTKCETIRAIAQIFLYSAHNYKFADHVKFNCAISFTHCYNNIAYSTSSVYSLLFHIFCFWSEHRHLQAVLCKSSNMEK